MAIDPKILRKLNLYRQNPDIVQPLSNAELADLVVLVLSQVDVISKAIDSKKLDLDTKIGTESNKLVEDTRKEVESLRKDITEQIRTQIEAGAKTLTETSTELEKRVAEAIENIRDGDDGIITDEEISRAAQVAYELIELPDFEELVSTEITTNGEAIRNALELLQGEARYSVEIEDVKGLEETLRQLAQRATTTGGSGIGKNQVYNFIRQAIADGTISSGGSSLPDQDGNSGKFLTTDGTDASWATLAGGGDMAAAVYDPAGGAAQVAFAGDLGALAPLDTVGTTEIDDNAVTFAKTQDIATNRILGRSTAGTGAIEALADNDARDIMGLATTDSPQFTGVNVGHATDTTITRVSAGKIAVEGVNVQSEPAEGAFVDGDKTKLDGIEAGADVTDTTNVTAAGALMDAELADIAFIKATSDAAVSDVNTGTDATKAVTPDALAGSNFGIRYVQIRVFEAATDTATGDGKATFKVPAGMDGMNLVSVDAEVDTAGTTGTTDIQIHNVDNALDMLSTKLTIDSGETGSDTAATAAVINTSNDHVNTNDIVRIDVDAVSTTAATGLLVTLGFQLA